MTDKKNTGRALSLKFESALKNFPVEKIDTSRGIISWGATNDYGQFLVGLKEDGSVHGGIINKKCTFIGGAGIKVENGDESILDNYDGEFSLNEIQEMLVMDNEIFNGFACIWRENDEGKYVAEPVDFELLRTTENNVVYGVSDNWNDRKVPIRYYRSLSYYDDDSLIDAFGEKIEIKHDVEEYAYIMVCIKRAKQRLINGRLTSNYYPTPSYSGAIKSIVALDNMNRYTMNETANGFKGGTHIAMHNGVPDTKEEAEKAVNDIKRPLTDIDNSGGIVVTFDEGGDSKTEINPINSNDLDKRYESAKVLAKEDILAGHSVPIGNLFGLPTSGIFSSGEELETAFNIFQTTYVLERQNFIAKSLTWALNELNGFEGEIKYVPYKLSLEANVENDSQNDKSKKTIEAINGMSPLVANKLLESLTTNEIRALASLPSIDGGDTVAVSTPQSQFQKFNSDEQDDMILKLFSECGREKSMVKFKSNFATPLSDYQKAVLTMMKEGQDFDSMVKALELSEARVYGIIVSLSDLGLIKDLGLTDKGQELALDEKDIEIVFSYEKKYNAPDLVKGGKSRNFCRSMMALDRVYTRDEINSISDQVGIDVWLYRGGWYHNPKLNINTPSCRHEWRQHSILNF